MISCTINNHASTAHQVNGCNNNEFDSKKVEPSKDHLAFYDSRLSTVDLDQMRIDAELARQKRDLQREMEKEEKIQEKKLEGIGSFVNQLRGVANNDGIKNRIVLDNTGSIVRRRPIRSNIGGQIALPTGISELLDNELPPLPPRPSDPKELRKLVRSKMIRCKVCGNRYGERNILERHLRDKHPVDYLEYIYNQELEVQQQREEELERNRIEELTSGGFIPPQSDIEAGGYDVHLGEIPLPGELSSGIPARFDGNGFLKQPRRPYKKKVSPQCVFCDKRFRNEISLKKHLAKKHPECTEFVQCLDCFKCLPTKEDIKDHLCDMTYLCIECTPIRNMCTEQRLVAHRLKFHRGANSGFRCHECNMKFLTPRKLRKHKKMSHVFSKTYSCHFCEELFVSEVSVVTHERIHTGIIKFECKICDFKANRYIEMEEHKKEEHGYMCSICQEKFAEWSEIKNHTLREHGGYLSSENSAGRWRSFQTVKKMIILQLWCFTSFGLPIFSKIPIKRKKLPSHLLNIFGLIHPLVPFCDCFENCILF